MKPYKFEIFTSTLEKNIREGIYQSGDKLPSVRDLKDKYQLSSSSIQNGYEHLIIQGLVESIPKSGYYVSRQLGKFHEPAKTKHSPIVRDALFENNLVSITSLKKGRKLSEFNVTAPGDLLVPQKLLLRTLQQVVREQGANLLRYYPSNGLPELKAAIAKRAAGYQTLLNPEELLITDGALQALYIALASVCAAGDVVAVESPCVFSVLEVIRVLKLKVVEIPVDTDTGFDVDFLRKVGLTNKISTVVVTPNFHNPTGILLSDEKKKALVSVAQDYGIALIENDIYGDLNFNGIRPTTLKSFDESGLVMTYSSYAKTLAPGIRMGWLSAGKFVQQAEQIKFSLGSTVSPIYQETVSRLLTANSYERHIRSFRTELAKNARLTLEILTENFPADTSMTLPAGGYSIWVRMPDAVHMDYFYAQCEKIGIRFTPGYTFSFSDTFSQYFRIVFAEVFTSKRIEAIRLAGQLLR